MQVKMVATTGRLPAVETALLDMEEHQDSANPFREEGQLSKFATDIVDAVKSGKLDQIKAERSEVENNNKSETKISREAADADTEMKTETEVRVERRLVEPRKLSQIETIVIPPGKLEKKFSCCVLL